MPAAKGSVPWNAGTGKGWTDKRGYQWLYVEECGRRVARRAHRVAMEAHLGRKLEPWELVHHKDGDPGHNAIENLVITKWGAHTREHHTGGRKSEEARRSMEAFALMREQLKREREVKADMLTALQYALQTMRQERAVRLSESGGAIGTCAIAIGMAEAAIAKATGAEMREASHG